MIDEATIATLISDVKHIREDAAEIKEQVKRTNGRVSKLEEWRSILIGAWGVLTIMGGVALAVLLRML